MADKDLAVTVHGVAACLVGQAAWQNQELCAQQRLMNGVFTQLLDEPFRPCMQSMNARRQ